MRKIKKLLAVGACLCMSLSLLAGCGSGAGGASDGGSSESGTKQESTKSSDLSFAFCTNTLNNTFQSSIDAKLKELCDANGISYTCLDPDYDLNTQLRYHIWSCRDQRCRNPNLQCRYSSYRG